MATDDRPADWTVPGEMAARIETLDNDLKRLEHRLVLARGELKSAERTIAATTALRDDYRKALDAITRQASA